LCSINQAMVVDGGWADMRLLLTSNNTLLQRAAIVSFPLFLRCASGPSRCVPPPLSPFCIADDVDGVCCVLVR
jgi:hypothetical protein